MSLKPSSTRAWLIDRWKEPAVGVPGMGGDSSGRSLFARWHEIAAVIRNQLANDRTGEVFVTELRTSAGAPLIPDESPLLNSIP